MSMYYATLWYYEAYYVVLHTPLACGMHNGIEDRKLQSDDVSLADCKNVATIFVISIIFQAGHPKAVSNVPHIHTLLVKKTI